MARQRDNPYLRLIGIILILAMTIDTLQRLVAIYNHQPPTKLLSK